MAERQAVVASCSGDTVQLRVQSPCSDCIGCGGRCNLFRSDSEGRLDLPVACFDAPPSDGDVVRLQLPDNWLRQTAWRVYGLAALGLLIGAGIGHFVAGQLDLPLDVMALMGAVGGTFFAMRVSKTRLPTITVIPHN